MLSRVGSKLGTGAALLIGGAVGHLLKKHHESAQQKSESSDELNDKKAVLTYQNEINRTLHKIHLGLKEFSPSCGTKHSIAAFYTKIAKLQCQQYLAHQKEEVGGGLKVWLSEWETEAEWVDTVDFWPPPPPRSASTPSLSAALRSSVKALWYISCCEDFCKENYVFSHDVMKSLKVVIEKGDTKAAPMALKVVANVAVHQEKHQLIHDTGLVDVLASSADHHHPFVFLPAWRALHNLKARRSNASKCTEVYMEGVYPFALPDDTEPRPLLDIVLVHGIEGGVPWTWRQQDKDAHRPRLPHSLRRKLHTLTEDVLDQYISFCWPLDWLVPALGLPVRVIALDFRASWWRWGCSSPEESIGKSLAGHSQELMAGLEAAGVGRRPIVWITHSMGGLLVKHMLMKSQQRKDRKEEDVRKAALDELELWQSSNGGLAEQTAAAVFFSVPHHGSQLATTTTSWPLSHLLQPTREVQEMRADNPQLKVIHESFLSLVKEKQVAVLSLLESQPTQHVVPGGWELHFVLPHQADPGVGEFHEVETTHRDICKPLDRNSDTFQKVLLFLKTHFHLM